MNGKDDDAQHDIGWAVKQMWNSDRVRRAGWSDKGGSLFLQRPQSGGDWAPYVVMVTAQGRMAPWTCSQADLLAHDWELA